MRERCSALSNLLVVAVAITLVFPLVSRPALARELPEEILSYHSDITVYPDASMLVKETIRVRAAGVEIKRGIYRDFPTRYRDRLGNTYVVKFQVQEVQRDDAPEEYRTESKANGVRVYIGRKNVFLRPGEYTYTLVYKTGRQLGFFPDHDELYWNVTGNGWAFPIQEASATVHLPKGIAKDAVLLDAYTGPQDSVGTAFQASVDPESNALFSTTRALGPQEGLTIVVRWPKGFVAEPTREAKFRYFLEDNRSTLVGLAGLIVLLAYYGLTWLAVGKDPEAGTIMPLYEPPAGFSPAAIRYLHRMEYDDRVFAANVINLAVKKFLTIKEDDGVYTLTRLEPSPSTLLPDEKVIADKLIGAQKEIVLKTENHRKIGDAIEALKKSLKFNMEKVYLFTNSRYLIPGLIISVLTLALSAVAVPGEQKFLAIFMCVWLTGWSVAVVFLVHQVIRAWQEVLFGGGHKAAALAMALFMSLFSLPFLAGEVGGLIALGWVTSAFVLLILIVMVLVNYLFHHLLKAPTHTGRALMDKIDGFRMFLSAVEEDRLRVLTPITRTSELFEKYLPYALALGVEHSWSHKFADVLSEAAKTGARGYSPAWYSGSSWHNVGATGFASSFGSSFSNAIASSSTAPGSRSGGGSSGGGGGGGGGGGW